MSGFVLSNNNDRTADSTWFNSYNVTCTSYFLRPASPFFGWSATLGGLGCIPFAAVPFADLVGGKNFMGLGGCTILAARLGREDEVADGRCTAYKLKTKKS